MGRPIKRGVACGACVSARYDPNGTYLKERTYDYLVIPAKAGIQGLKKHRPTGRFWNASFRWHDVVLLVWP
jgi:hypothetical protein